MILVVGATGRVGRKIVQRLLDEGRDVRMLVRSGSDYQQMAGAGAEAVEGDLKNPASLEAACQGVDTVVTTANSASRGGDDTVETVDRQGNQNLIEASAAANVRQFVFVSVLGADASVPVPFIQAKARTEAYLRTSGLRYTILSPAPFMDVWVSAVVGAPMERGEPVTLVGESRRSHAFIAEKDVAAFATAVIGHLSSIDQQIPIGGPQALSWLDIVAIYEQMLGKKATVHTVSPGQPVPGLPDMMSGLMAGMETFDTFVDMEETARAYNVTLTSIEDFVRDQVGGASE